MIVVCFSLALALDGLSWRTTRRARSRPQLTKTAPAPQLLATSRSPSPEPGCFRHPRTCPARGMPSARLGRISQLPSLRAPVLLARSQDGVLLLADNVDESLRGAIFMDICMLCRSIVCFLFAFDESLRSAPSMAELSRSAKRLLKGN